MQFEDAVMLAARMHKGQTDPADEIYLLHPLRVALRVSPRARNVGLLHDVLEDTDLTADQLLTEGLATEEVDAVVLLTRRTDESYEEFIERVVTADGEAGELAREVKRADVEDNYGRLPDSEDPDWRRRRARYEEALTRLPAGTPPTDSA